MRFVCDSCRAQYMISDEKVGPKGVKVRCKKCGFVIWVRHPEDAQAAAAAEESAAREAPPHEDFGENDHEPNERTQMVNPAAMLAEARRLKAEPTIAARTQIPLDEAAPTPIRSTVLGNVGEDEIGAAFDQALSAHSSSPPVPDVGAGRAADDDDDEDHAQTRVLDLKAVRALAAEAGVPAGQMRGNAAVAASPAPAAEPVRHEWYVAINDNQVGPVDVEKVKSLWKDGEIGPDSLCWRVGFSDWVPLSDATELASVLAPRPAKPTIVAPSAPPSSGRGPVESAFSRTTTGSQPAVGSDGGWRPSAGSELASLVKEEIEALSKPAVSKAATAKQDPGAGGKDPEMPGLMEVPSAEFPIPTAPVRQERPTRKAEANSFGAAGYAAYRPPPPPPSTFFSRNRSALLLAGCGVMVIGLLIAILVLLANPQAPAITVNVPSQQPAPAPQPEPVKRAEPPVPAQPPAQVAPTPPPTAPKVDETAQLPPVPGPSAKEQRRHPKGERRTGSSASNQVSEDDEVGSFTVGTPKSSPPPNPSATDDDFEREFGGARTAGGKGGKKKSPSTYVPPAPGSADIPESLSQSDVIQVVVQHKPAILKCAEEQKKVDPGTSGRLVMRWSILPSGRPTQVSTQSTEFKSTPMATCLTKLIPTWSFPRHKTQGPAIDFPFTF